LSGAEKLLKSAQADLPKNSAPYAVLGYVYLERNEPRKALRELEKALTLAQNEGSDTSPILTGLALAYFALYLEEKTESQLSSAFFYTNRAYAAAPQNVRNLVFKGDILLSENFKDLAASVYCLALQYLPEHSTIFEKLTQIKK